MKKSAKRQDSKEDFMNANQIEILKKDGKQVLVDRIHRFSPNFQERSKPKGLYGREDPTRIKIRREQQNGQ